MINEVFMSRLLNMQKPIYIFHIAILEFGKKLVFVKKCNIKADFFTHIYSFMLGPTRTQGWDSYLNRLAHLG